MLPKIKYLAIMTCLALILTGCTTTPNNHAGELNTKASLPASFNFKNKGLHVITSSVNKRENTTAVLYGNAAAQKFAATTAPTDSIGVLMTLVTWNQEDDERWFGGRIPGDLLCAETVTITGTPAAPQIKFELFNGALLTRETNTDSVDTAQRIKYILGRKASILPQ